MAKPHPTGMLTPQIPTPLRNRYVTASTTHHQQKAIAKPENPPLRRPPGQHDGADLVGDGGVVMPGLDHRRPAGRTCPGRLLLDPFVIALRPLRLFFAFPDSGSVIAPGTWCAAACSTPPAGCNSALRPSISQRGCSGSLMLPKMIAFRRARLLARGHDLAVAHRPIFLFGFDFARC